MRNDEQKRFSVDGLEEGSFDVDVEAFIFENIFDPEVDPTAIRSLRVGEEISFGGGAEPLVTLRREE